MDDAKTHKFLSKEVLLFKAYVLMLDRLLSDESLEQRYGNKIKELIKGLQTDVLKYDLSGSHLQA